MSEIEYATAEDDAEEVPEDQRCVWPGCRRRRVPGRPEGSGRQREYCLKADRAENGGGPVHNARNRWAWQRREAVAAGVSGGVFSNATVGEAGEGAGEAGISVPDNRDVGRGGLVGEVLPVSGARRRIGDLLDQARRQHAVALAAFTAERDLYAKVAGQFGVLADPAALDLELTAAGVRAGRDVAAAAEEAATARRAQRAAERERDDAVRRAAEADAAAEQFAADTETAEAAAEQARRVLGERTAEFDRARGELALRAGEAEKAAAEAGARAAAARTAAEAAVAEAAERADQAERQAEKAVADAGDRLARVREEAAGQVAAAQDEARRSRQRADDAADGARRDVAAAHEAAERARRETDGVRADAEAAREAAQARILAAETAAATSGARAAAAGEESARLREELRELRERHAAEVGRLDTAHRAALEAERARADRAEAELRRQYPRQL